MFKASNGMPVEFISSYAGAADYGVYLRRLGRQIRIRKDQVTGEFRQITSEATPEEASNALEAVKEYLAYKHDEYLKWAVRLGIVEMTFK